ncbi:phospholipid scramblase 4-like [Engraulis encrasicolus]|uniref:phospholipid scramblase 4-like n=1 Tax=Engraulis encrasicolus TaxID=184585 RepID=UPI002FCF4ECC
MGRYVVQNDSGQAVFHVQEEGGGGSQPSSDRRMRSFVLYVTDDTGRVIIMLRKPEPEACSCQCRPLLVEVLYPPGIPIGYVHDNSITSRGVIIQNDRQQSVLKIAETCCIQCCGEINLQITSLDGNVLGNVTKTAGKLEYNIQFPVDADVKVKATILGACVIMDILFYEEITKHMVAVCVMTLVSVLVNGICSAIFSSV